MEKKKLLQAILNEAAQNGIGTVDDLKRVSLRQCEVAMDSMYNDLLFMLLKDSASIDFFCKPYDEVDIDYNRTSKEYTVTLPVPVVQTQKNIGVHLVRGVGSNRKFYPTTNEDVDLFTDMDESTHYDRTLYVMDGNSKIKLLNFDYTSLNIRRVQLKLIPTFMSYDWSEDVPIPSGRITEVVGIVAKQLLKGKKFLDTSVDGNPT